MDTPTVRVVARSHQAALAGAQAIPRSRVRRRTRPGSRGAALLLLMLLAAALIALWRAPFFRVPSVAVQGAERLSPSLIERALQVTGKPVFGLAPARLERRLLALFPNLLEAHVTIGWPAQVTVQVVERQPRLTWERNAGRLYVDADGVAWMPFPDEPPAAVHVTALGPLPPIDAEMQAHNQTLRPEFVQLAVDLSSLKPESAALIYDPARGLGWRDPRGWDVFFGWDDQNLAVKARLLEALVAQFERQGRRPALIDLADLTAPFMLER